jgi:hypothetical protein
MQPQLTRQDMCLTFFLNLLHSLTVRVAISEALQWRGAAGG